MNCPHCNTPSQEGKKYCADCGTPLDQQTAYLKAYVTSRVGEAVEEKFKDRRLVDIETSQAVVERLQGWAKLFAFFVGIPVALFLIVLGIAGFQKFSDFSKLVASVEDQIRPKIEQAKADTELAQKTAREAKGEAEDSKNIIETATTEAKKQLGSASELAKNVDKNVKALSDKISGVEQETSDKMTASSQRIEARVAELNQKFDDTSKRMSEQEQKLASTDELVKTLFSKGVTEYFQTTANASNVLIVPLAKGAFVFMLLKSAPIYQTTEVKWRVASQPRSSYGITNNVLIFNWGDPAEALKQYPLEVTYVPDPTSKTNSIKALLIKDNTVFADGTKLMDLPH
jgi:hypothetical protein